MRTSRAVLAGLFLASILMIVPGHAPAQTKFYDYTLYGEADLGFRLFLDNPSDAERGKLEEYRDLKSGLYSDIHLQLLNAAEDYLMEFAGFQATHADQNFFLRSSKVGLYDLELEWDQLPHVFTTASPRVGEISLRRDTARVEFTLTPTPEWDITTEYTLINRHGDIPKGLAVGFFPGFNFVEIPFPVDTMQHDARITATLARKAYQVQLAYNLSLFDSDESTILVPGGGGLFDPRFSLPPDNAAHFFTLSGGVNLPYKTRINSTLSYGLRLQSEDFVRSAFDPPRQSDLDGMVGTYLVNISGSSRPIAPLTVKARYRFYHFDDSSDDIFVPDAGLLVERFDYSKHTAALDARWKFECPIAVGAGFEWERWERDQQLVEVDRTDEYTPRLSMDYTPFEWLMLRAAYSHSSRDGKDYRSLVATTPGQRLLRKFNLADRERDRLDFTAEVTPFNTLTISPHLGIAQDDYTKSEFGLQNDDYWAAGVDIAWRPVKRIGFTAGYLHEQYETRQRSGGEVDIDGGPVLQTDDIIDTFSLGMNAVLIPDRLNLDLRSSVSYASSDFNNALLTDFRDVLYQNTASLRYDFTGHWSARLGYLFEVFDMDDSMSQISVPVTTFVNDTYEDYTAHVLILSLGYRF